MKIKIEKIIFEGAGLGHDGDGRAIFVKKAVPGDEVEVKFTKEKKNFAEGLIQKIITPSLMRVEPPCPYFNECGGCEHQNMSYPDQLKIKGEIFNEVLSRAKIETLCEPIISGSDHPLYYRNSIRFFFITDSKNKISFARHHFENGKGYVKVESCLLQSETCNTILSNLKEYINKNIEHKSSLWQLKIREGKMTGEFMIEIITSDDSLPDKTGIVETLSAIKGIKSIYHTVAPSKSLINLKRHLIFGSPIILEKIGSYTFQISPESFFQTNSLGIKTLYDLIKKFSEIDINDTVFDLYCGTGTIGIYLSTLAKKVVGVEIVPEAVRDAIDNAKINKIHNIEFVSEGVLHYLKSNTSSFDNSIIILDPPRAGLDKELINVLSKINFKKIIYVSCNPATFARDIKLFEENGLKLNKVQPVDMFPQTHHIECVGVIGR